MSTLNISLPEPLREFVDSQVAEGGYRTASDYIRELVQEAQKRKAREKVEALLLEGLQSEASAMTKEDWEELKLRVGERHGQACEKGRSCFS
jgi:antitoxin ParD1/3/4